mmetsp:Transcript_22651/g.64125  ORF Transcript_22651/g.64125 Transcript_22651/m.64125 type:complete len:551 (+) Transcript_22651:551-2203(+)
MWHMRAHRCRRLARSSAHLNGNGIVVAVVEAKGVIQDVERSVEALEAVDELIFGDVQRWRAVNVRVPVKADESVGGVGILVLFERVVGLLVLQLGVLSVDVVHVEASEHSDRSVLLDARVVVGQLLHARFEERRHALRSADNVLLQQVLDVLVGDCHGDRVRLVGGSVPERLILKEVHDFLAAGSHGERDGGGRNPLGAADDVRHDAVVVLEPEELSGAAESDHDFVDVHEDAVLVAECTNTLHVPLGHDEAAAGPDDALHHDGCDVVGPFVQNLLLKHVERGLHALLFGGVVASVLEEERERIERLDEARDVVRAVPATEIAGCRARMRGGSVVGSVPADDLFAARDAPRHHDARLVGLGSRGWVDGRLQIARQDLLHELVESHPNLWNANAAVRERQLSHLLRGGLDDRLWHVVAQVGADRLRRPVQVLLALVVVEVRSLAVGHVGHFLARRSWHPSHHEWDVPSGLVDLVCRPATHRLEVVWIHNRICVGEVVLGIDGWQGARPVGGGLGDLATEPQCCFLRDGAHGDFAGDGDGDVVGVAAAVVGA